MERSFIVIIIALTFDDIASVHRVVPGCGGAAWGRRSAVVLG